MVNNNLHTKVATEIEVPKQGVLPRDEGDEAMK